MSLVNKHRNFKPRHCQGFSIVELMVALVISLVLMSGISQIFLSSKKSFIIQDSLGRQQENGRFIIDALTQDLRRAGFLGGMGINTVLGTEGEVADDGTCPTADNSWGRMLENRIFGLNDSNTSYVSSSTYACIPDTDYLRGDILVVRYQAPWTIGGMTTPTLEDDRLYLRSSLVTAKLFKGKDNAVASNALTSVTGSTAQLVARAYYIGTSSSSDCGGGSVSIPTLYRESLDDNGRPVAEAVAYGIENLQVRYGVDADDDGAVDRYFNAGDTDLNEASEWQSVIAAQVSILVRSECPESGFDTTGTSYTMGDVTYNPGDTAGRGYRRQLYQTTVKLRNAKR